MLFFSGGESSLRQGSLCGDLHTRDNNCFCIEIFVDENTSFLYGFCQGERGTKLYDAVQKAVDETTLIYWYVYVENFPEV